MAHSHTHTGTHTHTHTDLETEPFLQLAAEMAGLPGTVVNDSPVADSHLSGLQDAANIMSIKIHFPMSTRPVLPW